VKRVSLAVEEVRKKIDEILLENLNFEDRSGSGSYEPFYDPVYDEEHSCWDRDHEEEDNTRANIRSTCRRILEALDGISE